MFVVINKVSLVCILVRLLNVLTLFVARNGVSPVTITWLWLNLEKF